MLLISALILPLSLAPPRAGAADLAQLSSWSPDSAIGVDHAAWANFLQRYLDTSTDDGVNRLRYGVVSPADRKALDGYIAALAKLDPAKLNRNEACAYWINLYNALTVDLVLDHYAKKSIRDVRPSPIAIGSWKMKPVTVMGKALTMSIIEHAILRAAFKDARVHYAVNCASIGCPNLRPKPFSGEALDAALDAAAREYVNHARCARFDAAGCLTVSSIYKWFRQDFGGSDASVITHLSHHADPTLAARLKGVRTIAAFDYDWTLNDAK